MYDHTMSITDKYKKALELIEEFTTNTDEIQKRVLSEILSRSSHVEYLQRHGLNGRTDRESFKKLMPVVTYEDLLPDINRIANGDTSPILCGQPITEFHTSSGTSGGERKLIPTTKEELKRLYQVVSFIVPILNHYFPGLNKGKGMYFQFIKSESKTPGGLVARTATTRAYKSIPISVKEKSISDPYSDQTSPIETILCEDSYQSMYAQLLCGLYQNNLVLRVGAPFAFGVILAIRFLQNHWTLLCKDIRTGTLNTQIITDQSVREAVMKLLLEPNPNLADFIETECNRDSSWQGIIPRLWPNTKYIDTIITGSMSQYIPIFDFYSSGLPLVTKVYASSECSFGVNLNPLCKPSEVSYTFLPTMAYFEFLPIQGSSVDIDGDVITNSISSIPNSLNDDDGQRKEQQEELVDLVSVKLGQEYELVITTYAGLYRYRVGDVLRVVGFKNASPQFKFICRKNVILSIDTDKTGEVELQNAVENSVKHLIPFHAYVDEYTSYADTSTIPGHYVLYWELRSHGSSPTSSIPPSVFEACCLTIEESLNIVYRQNRVSGKSIGPLEIRIVETGTFNKLMDYANSRGSSLAQYKTPRCVRSSLLVELLNSSVISSYFSQNCPKWVPGQAWYDT